MKKIIIFVFIFCTLFIKVDGQSLDSTLIVNGEIVDGKDIQLIDTDDIKEIKPSNDLYNRLYDYANGYSIEYPNNMWVDVSLSPIKTIISDNATKIAIYHDDFTGTVHYPMGYFYYSNKFLDNKSDHKLEERKIININGLKAQLIKWNREKLSGIADDKNYYVSCELIAGNREVYTILIKSKNPISNYTEILSTFNIIPKKGRAMLLDKYKITNKIWNEETKDVYNNYFINNKLSWGIYYPGAPGDMKSLKSFENKLTYKFNVLVRYQTLDEKAPIEDLKNAYEDNRLVELTLQTMKLNENNHGVLYEILRGEYEDYFNDYAKELKAFGHPVLFRLNNEMNGDWCVYSSFHHSKDTDIYIEVWRYIYDIFEKNGVNNVIWVWNPNDISYPNFKWNHSLNYYPGDKYIDVVGMTGYNTGTYYQGEIWRNFKEIYDPLYEEYLNYFEQPLMITEFGSNSIGGSKEEWIEEMFKEMSNYEKLKVIIWFNGIDVDTQGNPARIYKIDEKEEYIMKFKDGLEEIIKKDTTNQLNNQEMEIDEKY